MNPDTSPQLVCRSSTSLQQGQSLQGPAALSPAHCETIPHHLTTWEQHRFEAFTLLVSVRRLLSQPTDIQSQIRHNYEKGPFNNPHSQLDISGKQFAKVWAGTRRAISRGVSLTNGHWSPVS